MRVFQGLRARAAGPRADARGSRGGPVLPTPRSRLPRSLGRRHREDRYGRDNTYIHLVEKLFFAVLQWIVPQLFKLLPMRHICFDLVIRFITNRKYAFFCIF